MDYESRLNFLYDTSYTLYDKIKVFLGNDIENIGLVYYDINSKDKISINEDLQFTTASTYKVGLNLLFYSLVSKGEINLNGFYYLKMILTFHTY